MNQKRMKEDIGIGHNMPLSKERKRGIIRYATIHPKGHPEEYIHIAIVKKAGIRYGHTVAGPVHEEK